MNNNFFYFVVPFLGFWLIVFGFIAFWRYMAYRETIALAEKGLVRPVQTNGNGKGTLRWGILIAALGVALTIGLYPFGFLFTTTRAGVSVSLFPLNFGPWMLVGLIPLFFGLGLILIYVVTREEKAKDEPK